MRNTDSITNLPDQECNPREVQGIWLYGAGGHNSVVISIIRKMGLEPLGVFDDRHEELKAAGIPILPGILDPEFRRPSGPLIVTVGNNLARKALATDLQGPFATAIHPSALITESTIGPGSVVMQGAIVQTRTRIGGHAIINTAASIDHENLIDDFVHISPNATLSGNVHVGEGSWVGAGATVIQGIRIGKWAMVGAGAVVIRDVPDFATVVGNPARVIKITNLESRVLDDYESSLLSMPPRLKSNLLLIVNQVLNNSGKEPVRDLGRESSLQRDLGFDSVELAELTVRIEAEFGVDIFADGIVRTVGEIVDKLVKKDE